MTNGRRKFTGEAKMAILRRHLVEKMPVSEVCDRSGINPTLFYRWQKERLGNGRLRSGGGVMIGAHEHWHSAVSYSNV